MSKHTPGPWFQGGNSGGDVDHWKRDVRAADGTGIAWCGSFPKEEAHANARLIAAAPDLLRALQGMCSMWTTVCNSKGWEPDHMQQFINACAAIAKAEGKT